MKTCINHPERKAKAKNLCNTCYEKYLHEKNPEYKEKQKLNVKNWRNRNKDKIEQYLKVRRLKEKTTIEGKRRIRNKALKKYNLDLDQYNELLKQQNNKCKICEKEQTKSFHVDHCHKTGKVRGLLCAQCNWFVGKIDRNQNVIQNLNNYVNGTRKEIQ